MMNIVTKLVLAIFVHTVNITIEIALATLIHIMKYDGYWLLSYSYGDILVSKSSRQGRNWPTNSLDLLWCTLMLYIPQTLLTIMLNCSVVTGRQNDSITRRNSPFVIPSVFSVS